MANILTKPVCVNPCKVKFYAVARNVSYSKSLPAPLEELKVELVGGTCPNAKNKAKIIPGCPIQG